jgi:hypothetical protein
MKPNGGSLAPATAAATTALAFAGPNAFSRLHWTNQARNSPASTSRSESTSSNGEVVVGLTRSIPRMSIPHRRQSERFKRYPVAEAVDELTDKILEPMGLEILKVELNDRQTWPRLHSSILDHLV